MRKYISIKLSLAIAIGSLGIGCEFVTGVGIVALNPKLITVHQNYAIEGAPLNRKHRHLLPASAGLIASTNQVEVLMVGKFKSAFSGGTFPAILVGDVVCNLSPEQANIPPKDSVIVVSGCWNKSQSVDFSGLTGCVWKLLSDLPSDDEIAIASSQVIKKDGNSAGIILQAPYTLHYSTKSKE